MYPLVSLSVRATAETHRIDWRQEARSLAVLFARERDRREMATTASALAGVGLFRKAATRWLSSRVVFERPNARFTLVETSWGNDRGVLVAH